MRNVLLSLAVLSLVAGLSMVSSAQFTPGNVIVTYLDTASPANNTTIELDLNTNTVTTITGTVGYQGNWVLMKDDNKTVIIGGGSTSTTTVLEVDQLGGVTTFPIGWRTDGIRHTDDLGLTWSPCCGTGQLNVLLRTDRSYGSVSTVANPVTTTGASLSHVQKEDNGNYITVAQSSSNGAFNEVDPKTGTIVKSLTGVRLVNTVDYHKGLGKIYAVEFAVPGNTSAARGSLFEVDMNLTSVTSLIDGTSSQGALVDRLNWVEVTRDGNLLIGARHKIFKFDLGTTSITNTWTFQTDRAKAVTGATVYASRPLDLDVTGGSTVKLSLHFGAYSSAAGAQYFCACSTLLRPGITLNNQVLDLGIDPMFLVSLWGLAPTIFQNFSGTLNSSGEAFPQVNIPAGIPSGLRIYAGCIATINSQIVVGNVEGFVTP